MLDEETKFHRPLLWISFFIQIHLYKPETVFYNALFHCCELRDKNSIINNKLKWYLFKLFQVHVTWTLYLYFILFI